MYTEQDLMKALLRERVKMVRWIYYYADEVAQETGVYGVALATIIRDVAGKLNTFTDKKDTLLGDDLPTDQTVSPLARP